MAQRPLKHHFVCLPYINLGHIPEVDLGFVKIWNFDLLSEKYLPDPDLRQCVQNVLNNHRSPHPFKGIRPPLRGIGIIETGIPSENEFNEDIRQRVDDVRLILFIAFISQNNTRTRDFNSGHSMASAENFSSEYFSVLVGNDYISETTGFVVPTMHGGIKIKENIIIRPKHIPTPSFYVDGKLVNALIELRSKHKRKFRRIISAVEVFYEACYNSTEVSLNARILLQSSAFEILLDKNGGEARLALKKYLGLVADYPQDRHYSYKSERKNGRTEQESGTKRIMWADRFFTLRNHITHGLVPKKKEFFFGKWQSHFDIAVYFFVFCLKRRLEEGLGKSIFNDDVMWATWTDELQEPPRTYSGFQYVHYGRRGWTNKNP